MTPLRSWIIALACVICLGCGQRNQDFIPSEDTARHALEAYLTAWQNGDRSQTVAGTKPPVMSADGLLLAGRTLERFTVLGPAPGDAPRCFAVRLSLGNPKAELRERYVVVGLDPLWVFRYEDYEMLTHWDHKMPAATKPDAAASPKQP